MKNDIQTLSALVNEHVSYEPDTGLLRWKTASRKRSPKTIGSVAGGGSTGRVYVTIKQNRLVAARVAWYLAHGKWPDGVIDHINGNPLDNRLCNLRDVPQSVNTQNLRQAKRTNKLGVQGVHMRDGKFRADIGIHGKTIHLGSFETLELAQLAYLAKKREIHEGCTV